MKQRLELTWIGKQTKPKLEPRILVEEPKKSFGSYDTENKLIHGDNLLALKALEQDYAGKIKCIYIDPPYNTGNAFAHYDDGLEHSIWLGLIRDRLSILKNLLSEEGSIWISIDDDECHYLKVLCDEVFGRNNYITTNLWQKRTSPDMRAIISDGHEYVLTYAKNKNIFKSVRNKIPLNESQIKNYKNPDKDPNGPWTSSDFTAQGFRPNQMYTITTPAGVKYTPPEGRCWKNVENVYKTQVEEGRMWFGVNGKGIPRRKTYLNEREGVVPWTWWTNKEVGHSQEAKKEIISLFGADNIFDTPKPERLIERIIHISTNPGDFVLDSFLGSGTTAAVAHKMKRKWIGIELGDHCYSHCKVRIDKVVKGDDQGGISKTVNWKKGGGYKFYELAPSLLNKDDHGNWIINKQYNADMLASAMAKQEGFKYNPDPDQYWKQGQSTEQDFIFTTTEFLTQEHLEHIQSQMKDGESLLICCKAFNANDSLYPNISIKKIPLVLMGKCEFGKDDYSLNIINIPTEDTEQEIPDSVSVQKPKYIAGQAELFDMEDDNE